MMVGLNTDGQLLKPEAWSPHDLSQLGLRLGWLHRLLKEQMKSLSATEPIPARWDAGLAESLRNATQKPPAELPHRMPHLKASDLQRLADTLSEIPPSGWCHGDVQPAAFPGSRSADSHRCGLGAAAPRRSAGRFNRRLYLLVHRG